MNKLKFRRILQLTILYAVAMSMFSASANAEPMVDIPANVSFEYPQNNSHVVMTYRIHNEIVSVETPPLITIYGNGKVRIHYPNYMKKAGDYEFWLSDTELDDLLSSMNNDGLMDYSSPLLEQQYAEALEVQQDSYDLFEISDQTTTIIRFNINRSVNANSSETINKELKWQSLEQIPQGLSNHPVLNDINRAETKIKALLDREDLIKIQ